MSITLFLPFLFGLAFFVTVARTAFNRPRRRRIDTVIPFVRKLDVSELEVLMDAGQEWSLRHFLTEDAFRVAQHERIRLVGEYLRRVAHNAAVIQLWMSGEYEPIKHKEREKLSEKEALIFDLLQIATELRIYSMGALFKVWSWKTFRVDRWPTRLVPEVTDLRVTCGVNVCDKYRQLTQIVFVLSGTYGQSYQERLLSAL
jgi:hypothetical protein